MFNLLCKSSALVFITVLYCSNTLQAQSLSINSVNTSFTVNTTNQITTGITNTNAFRLNVNSARRAYNLKAAVTAKSFNPSTTTFSTLPLSIVFKGVTGVATTGGVSGNIQLVENPPGWSTLATNATQTGTGGTAVWTYDLILAPIGYNIPAGSYVFTITIQYTDGPNTINRTFNVTLNVQNVVAIALVQNGSTNISFGTSTAYQDGISSNNFHILQVRSNASWLVNVTAPAFFTASGGGASANMPSSIIGIRRNGTVTYTNLSTTPQTIRTGTAGDITSGNNSTSFDMLFSPGYNYAPGIYNIALTYTVTNQ